MNHPRVSIVLAVHNGEEVIGQALNSLLQQSYLDLEVIVVNDASVDHTGQVLSSFQDPRVHCITNEKNLGLTASLNIALSVCEGDFIFRLDADDIALPNRVQEQLDAMIKGNADICFSRGYITLDSSSPSKIWCEGNWGSILWRGLFENSYGLHSSVAFRHQAVMEVGGYNPAFYRSQDYDLWDRCAQAGLKFIYVKKPLIRYFLTDTGISVRHRLEQEACARQVSYRAIERLLPSVERQIAASIRWLFLDREDCYEPSSLKSALLECKHLAGHFLSTNSTIEAPPIWKNTAMRCVVRWPLLDSSQRQVALRLAILAGLKSKSPHVLAKVCLAVLRPTQGVQASDQYAHQ